MRRGQRTALGKKRTEYGYSKGWGWDDWRKVQRKRKEKVMPVCCVRFSQAQANINIMTGF